VAELLAAIAAKRARSEMVLLETAMTSYMQSQGVAAGSGASDEDAAPGQGRNGSNGSKRSSNCSKSSALDSVCLADLDKAVRKALKRLAKECDNGEGGAWDKAFQKALKQLAVDGAAITAAAPAAMSKPAARLTKLPQKGEVLERPFVPFDVRTARLLGLPP
jgi:hypothetical protein